MTEQEAEAVEHLKGAIKSGWAHMRKWKDGNYRNTFAEALALINAQEEEIARLKNSAMSAEK